MQRVQRIYGYLKRFNNGNICFRVGEPDYSDLMKKEQDWHKTVYGESVLDIPKDIPKDIPTPLGKQVVTTTYVDANLMHCLMTSQASTGILHLLNATPID